MCSFTRRDTANTVTVASNILKAALCSPLTVLSVSLVRWMALQRCVAQLELRCCEVHWQHQLYGSASATVIRMTGVKDDSLLSAADCPEGALSAAASGTYLLWYTCCEQCVGFVRCT
jgi:hypothetical protein